MNKSMNINMGLSGRFMVEVIRADGTVEEVAPWQDNLITDLGLARFNVDNGVNFTQLHVGTGSTAPDPGDTALTSRLTSIGVSYTATVSYTAPRYRKTTCVATFGVGQAAGNVAELGIGGAVSAAHLFSRALIKDEFGVPQVITTLADEQLRITYSLYEHWMDTQADTVIDVNGTLHTFSVLPYYLGGTGAVSTSWYLPGSILMPSTKVDRAGSYPQGHTVKEYPFSFIGVTSIHTGNSLGVGISNIVRTSSPGNYSLEWDQTFGLSHGAGFTNGVGGFTFSTFDGAAGSFSYFFQVKIEPAIPKDDTMYFSARARVTWDRV
jgi:hypothetical protein